MLIKQTVMINDPISFKRNGYRYNLSLVSASSVKHQEENGWIALHEVEIETNVEEAQLMSSITKALDSKEDELLAKLEVLRQTRRELFSITYQPDTAIKSSEFGDSDTASFYESSPDKIEPQNLEIAADDFIDDLESPDETDGIDFADQSEPPPENSRYFSDDELPL